MRLLVRTVLFAAVFGISGVSLACRETTSPVALPAIARDTLALFQTDSLHYTLSVDPTALGYQVQLGVVFTNRTPRTAYFVNCGGGTSISLEKLVGARWQTVWTPILLACLSSPITVPPGGTYRRQLDVFGARPGTNMMPQFSMTDLTGVYRLAWHEVVYDYQDHLPWGEPLAAEHTVSNRFTLTASAP
jgi:hypothetical protein